MLRWWNTESYLNKECKCDDACLRITDENLRPWKFRVRAEGVFPGEAVCVTGNCDSLGNWRHDRVVVLSKEDGEDNLWSGWVTVPQLSVEYRYVVCVVIEPDGHKITHRQFIVRRWETHTSPRKIYQSTKIACENEDVEPEVLGLFENQDKMERGWLTSETAIQLKLFDNHLQIWKPKLIGRKIHVKVTPINLARSNSLTQDVTQAEDCLSLETMDLNDKSECWPVTEIAVMNHTEREFKFQEQFGRAFEPGDFITFQILVNYLESTAFLIDFYTYAKGVGDDEPPVHVGFSYILPSAMKHSEGQAVVPITSTRHRPIGQVTVEYLVIKSMSNFTCDLRSSSQRKWKESWRGLDVGHRGSGTSFGIKQCAEVRENTIASLKQAASHGADFVEFDVQLSKDLVPVLYHDFYVAIAMKRKKTVCPEEMIQLPVKDLSLEQLHLLKDPAEKGQLLSKFFHLYNDSVEGLYHVGERTASNSYSDEDLEEHQPFPTLQQALEILDESVGFDIEIKWTMQLKDGTYELYHPFDLNLYLDTVLDVVLKYGGQRNIVFSCFHPDICSMIRLKQNRYPVMFLTMGITDKYPPYHDPRCQNVPIAVDFALSMNILGISVHTEDILRDSSQVALVRQAGLVLFCWGDDNNDSHTIDKLKKMGIHAVIYDRIEVLGNKEVKESIFSLEAREKERAVIRAVAERSVSIEERTQVPTSTPSCRESLPVPPAPQTQEEGMQIRRIEEAKEELSCPSVSSSVSLWTKDVNGHPSPDKPNGSI